MANMVAKDRLASPAERWGGFGTCVQNKTTGQRKSAQLPSRPILQDHHCLMGQGYPQDQHIDSESIKTAPDKLRTQVACEAKPRTCHTNTNHL